MPTVIRAFVATHRPSRFDDVPREVYSPLQHKFAYGLKIHINDRASDIVSSWIRSKEPMLPQIAAVDCLLTAMEEREGPFEIRFFMRTAHLLRRVGMVEDRLLKKQLNRTVRPMKNETLWEDTVQRLGLHSYGIRPAIDAGETSELELLEEALKREFYSGTRFSSAMPPQPNLTLADE